MNTFWQFDTQLFQVLKQEQIYHTKDPFTFPSSDKTGNIS